MELTLYVAKQKTGEKVDMGRNQESEHKHHKCTFLWNTVTESIDRGSFRLWGYWRVKYFIRLRHGT